ncbi:protein translocase subunit SecF [Nitratifractor sp.]
MELFSYKKPINFMGASRKFGLLSLVLVLLSWGLIFTKGFNYGIDFAGGTLIQLRYEGKAPLQKIREDLKKTPAFKDATVTFFGSENEVVIRTKSSSKTVGKDMGDRVRTLLADTGKFEVRRVDMVGPKIGNELKEKGLTAMVLAILGILIYVSVRFEWRFALASVLALVHDVSIAMGAIVLAGVEVNLDILAALLTLLGYSLNDTIIVFDRIREGLQKIKNPDLPEIINESITRTLSRTVLTSLTTFFVVLSLFLFGGEIIYGFSFTMLVGIIVGTYSSIFIASPLLMWLGFDVKAWRAKEAEKRKREKEKEKMRAMYEQGTI